MTPRAIICFAIGSMFLASFQSPTIGKYERSDPHKFRQAEPAKSICADCNPPHNLPYPG